MPNSSEVFSSVGTKVSVSAASPATFDNAGFSALTYALVGELSDLPSFGAEAALATHTPLATGVVHKRRGSVNYGSVTLTLALTKTDAGQVICESAANAAPGADSDVAVRIELPNGAKQFFTAQVMSFKTNVSNADAITMAECVLEIDSIVVKVAAP